MKGDCLAFSGLENESLLKALRSFFSAPKRRRENGLKTRVTHNS
jgi:hypothetical protein